MAQVGIINSVRKSKNEFIPLKMTLSMGADRFENNIYLGRLLHFIEHSVHEITMDDSYRKHFKRIHFSH